MWNWENKVVFNYIYYSRFIASWVKVNTKKKKPTYFDEEFKDWLRSLKVEEEDVNNIYLMATNGKLELEMHAERFLNK